MANTEAVAAGIPAHVAPELVWDASYDLFTAEDDDPYLAVSRLSGGRLPPIHNCLGIHLAKRELKIVIEQFCRASATSASKRTISSVITRAAPLVSIICRWCGTGCELNERVGHPLQGRGEAILSQTEASGA